MLCSVCDHRSEGEGGGSDVRKQVVAADGGCLQEDSVVVRMLVQLLQVMFKSEFFTSCVVSVICGGLSDKRGHE